MRHCAFLAATLLCAPLLLPAQTAELYQGRPSLLDESHHVRVTYDEAQKALRFDGITAVLSRRLPPSDCKGTGALTIVRGHMLFGSLHTPDLRIERVFCRFENHDRALTFYGSEHICSLDMTKVSPWVKYLIMQAWAWPPSGVKQFQGLTAWLDPSHPAPTFLGQDWGGCGSRKYTGDPMSLNVQDADIREYFRVVKDISLLTVSLDPSVSGTFSLYIQEAPWDMTLPLVADRSGLKCKLQGTTLFVRKQAATPAAP